MTSSTAMEQWSERTPAVRDLLNPALISAVIATSATQYENRSGDPMPFELAFLVAPLVLHRATRDALPRGINSHLAKWVITNEVLAAGFGKRAKALVGPVREGLRFALRNGAIGLDGARITGHLRKGAPARIGDIGNVVNRAGFVGRWLTQIESPATAFALLGMEV